ncbi:ECM2 protein, partial [Atractosteus spatula]|nr:ECM2 protein [Atractosteus spatula]
MQPKTILTLMLLFILSLSLAQEAGSPLRKEKKRRGGQRQGRNKQLRQKTSDAPVRLGNVPVTNADDSSPIFIQSYKSVDEFESNYNILPGKKGQCTYHGITMFENAVWSPKPCITCMCSNGNIACDEVKCTPLSCPITVKPTGECCPVCTDIGICPHRLHPPLLSSSDRLSSTADRKKQKLEKFGKPFPTISSNKQRQLFEERRREEEELREKVEEEEGERRRERVEEEQQRRQEEEDRRRQEQEEERERYRRLQEERRQEEERRRRIEEDWRELEEDREDSREEEEEDEDDLRGDVFRMLPRVPKPEGVPPLRPPAPENIPPYSTLPVGCMISDVTLSCNNAKLTGIPPLSVRGLKSLNLEGNAITTIPAEAFNGIPNLEWIDLSKNKITTAGIHPQAFKNLKNLKRLNMDGNLLDQIPSDLPSTLEEFKINENNLQSMDEDSLQESIQKEILYLDPTQRHLQMASSHFTLQLTTSSPLKLSRCEPGVSLELYIENNLIEEISETAFNHTKNLNIVVLRHNKIDESRIARLAWINLENLESIDLSHNKLYHVPSFLPKSLIHLVLVGNQIERIPGYVFAHMKPGLEYLYLSFNKLDNEGIDPVHFEPEAICDPLNIEDLNIVTLRMDNNLIDTRNISPTAFSCIRSYSSVVLKPQKIK